MGRQSFAKIHCLSLCCSVKHYLTVFIWDSILFFNTGIHSPLFVTYDFRRIRPGNPSVLYRKWDQCIVKPLFLNRADHNVKLKPKTIWNAVFFHQKTFVTMNFGFWRTLYSEIRHVCTLPRPVKLSWSANASSREVWQHSYMLLVAMQLSWLSHV